MITLVDSKEYLAEDWTLREPLRGVWRASLLIATDDQVSIGQRVTIGESAWSGTITVAARIGGKVRIEIVGGAHGLRLFTSARQYEAPSFQSILDDLCADAGETAATVDGQIGAWRARGAQLERELTRLSPDWYVRADGAIALAREATEAPAPGELLRAVGDALVYACDEPTPLAGATVEGTRVETALFVRGKGRPHVALYPYREPMRAEPVIEIGTVDKLEGGRASIALDSGETLSNVPLFCAAGFVPEGARGVRVLVLDVGGDASHTIALTGVDGEIDALTLARAADAGPLLRAGDKVMISGLISAAPMSPVQSPPGAVTINYDPTLTSEGPPGQGKSRVKG